MAWTLYHWLAHKYLYGVIGNPHRIWHGCAIARSLTGVRFVLGWRIMVWYVSTIVW